MRREFSATILIIMYRIEPHVRRVSSSRVQSTDEFVE
jgi:hypothetical protein